MLFHNPRCSKSRQALAFLSDQNVTVEVVEYLKNPLNVEQVNTLYKALAIDSAHDMIRPKEAEFSLAGLSKEATNEEVINAIAQYPKLLERPILLLGESAAIGRPLENIAALLNG